MIQKPDPKRIEGMDDFHRYVTDPRKAADLITQAAKGLDEFCRPYRKNYRTATDFRFARDEQSNRIATLRSIAKDLTAIADHVQSASAKE